MRIYKIYLWLVVALICLQQVVLAKGRSTSHSRRRGHKSSGSLIGSSRHYSHSNGFRSSYRGSHSHSSTGIKPHRRSSNAGLSSIKHDRGKFSYVQGHRAIEILFSFLIFELLSDPNESGFKTMEASTHRRHSVASGRKLKKYRNHRKPIRRVRKNCRKSEKNCENNTTTTTTKPIIETTTSGPRIETISTTTLTPMAYSISTTPTAMATPTFPPKPLAITTTASTDATSNNTSP